ncbi:MAG: hypothetical protein KME22_10220 [Hassallia sp. WJT32-NPBG1]|jgi:hypothetical protein|nr:hypothetical protein [Hassallia sp. WJT32-NPBG1]
MAIKKDKVGTVTGANLNPKSRGKKGGLTNSARVTGTNTEATEESKPIGEKFQDSIQTVGAAINTVNNTVSTIQYYASQVQGAIKGTANDSSPLAVTDGKINSAEILAKATAEIDESIGKLEGGEATRRNIIIAQQRNYVGVATNNVRLQQDIATLNNEQKRLIGLLVDGKTLDINNETKAVGYHRAVTHRDTEISALEQDRELLTHQRIRTEGTQQQTSLVRDQEQLKIQKMKEEVDKQRFEIENLQHEKEVIKQQVAAKFMAGF